MFFLFAYHSTSGFNFSHVLTKACCFVGFCQNLFHPVILVLSGRKKNLLIVFRTAGLLFCVYNEGTEHNYSSWKAVLGPFFFF